MSGKRTKQLRRECQRRLGRTPQKADLERNQLDEFRFFKRHGVTPRAGLKEARDGDHN